MRMTAIAMAAAHRPRASRGSGAPRARTVPALCPGRSSYRPGRGSPARGLRSARPASPPGWPGAPHSIRASPAERPKCKAPSRRPQRGGVDSLHAPCRRAWRRRGWRNRRLRRAELGRDEPRRNRLPGPRSMGPWEDWSRPPRPELEQPHATSARRERPRTPSPAWANEVGVAPAVAGAPDRRRSAASPGQARGPTARSRPTTTRLGPRRARRPTPRWRGGGSERIVAEWLAC